MSKTIEFTNATEIVVTLQKNSQKKPFPSEEEWSEHNQEISRTAAKELFNCLALESCIAFWLHMTEEIRKHCIQADEENAKLGIHVPPEGHFRRMFDEVAKGVEI